MKLSGQDVVMHALSQQPKEYRAPRRITPDGPQCFVLVTVPERWATLEEERENGNRYIGESRSLIGPFSTIDAAQEWRDTRIDAEGATSEIVFPERPR